MSLREKTSNLFNRFKKAETSRRGRTQPDSETDLLNRIKIDDMVETQPSPEDDLSAQIKIGDEVEAQSSTNRGDQQTWQAEQNPWLQTEVQEILQTQLSEMFSLPRGWKIRLDDDRLTLDTQDPHYLGTGQTNQELKSDLERLLQTVQKEGLTKSEISARAQHLLNKHKAVIVTALSSALNIIATNHPETAADRRYQDLKKQLSPKTTHFDTQSQARSQENPQTTLISLTVDGEQINIPTQIAITYQDILASRLQSIVEIREPVSDSVRTQFLTAVLSDLREDIARMRKEGKNNRRIYLELAVKYHPDLYQQAPEEVQHLANEYFQALSALKQNGEI